MAKPSFGGRGYHPSKFTSRLLKTCNYLKSLKYEHFWILILLSGIWAFSGQSPLPIGDLPSPPTASKTAVGQKQAYLFDQRLDLNRASASNLIGLPGIGPKLAQRIVEYRSRKKGFRSVDRLLRVRGIGPKTLARLRDRVVVRPDGPE